MLSPVYMLLPLGIAALVGGIIGAEREYRNKSAGFRTLILICMGSCLFTMLSSIIGTDAQDRVAANIVTGIGFLGAGVIFKDGFSVNGLTTAASIWVTAALGMTIGAGYYVSAIIGCLVVFAVLNVFTILENWIEHRNQIRHYKIVCEYDPGALHKYEDMMRSFRLKFEIITQHKTGTRIRGHWSVRGTEERHKQFTEAILNDNSVTEFYF